MIAGPCRSLVFYTYWKYFEYIIHLFISIGSQKAGSVMNSSTSQMPVYVGMKRFCDSISKEEKDHCDILCARAFFSGNLPFNLVENDDFSNFVKALRPSYKLPTRKIVRNLPLFHTIHIIAPAVLTCTFNLL